MDVGLFDLYTSGHHLPYADRIHRAVDGVRGFDATFVTVSATDGCAEVFEETDVEFLDEPDSPRIEDRDGEFVDVSNAFVRQFFDERLSEYDVVHFLFADDILGPLWTHSRGSVGPRLVGELNGNFFKRATPLRRPYLHPLFRNTLRSPVAPVIDAAVPALSSHQSLWRDLYLYRCLRDESFDHLVVHSEEAEAYVSSVDPGRTTPTANIPYPAPEAFGTEISQREARDRLDLPSDASILLFFGTLRSEKGIDRLLEALRQYQGPEFTMVVAGPPVSVTEAEVRTVAEASAVNVVTVLEYLTSPAVYYRAADALLLPYTREFGRECTSQTLGEACSAMRPVVVPDFGVVGRITREWNLGTTYTQGSTDDLIRTMATFASEGVSFSAERMNRYNHRHSVGTVATELTAVYASPRKVVSE